MVKHLQHHDSVLLTTLPVGTSKPESYVIHERFDDYCQCCKNRGAFIGDVSGTCRFDYWISGLGNRP